MTPTVFNGEQFLLLAWLPNWADRYRVTVRRPVHVDSSIGTAEVRRATSDSTRITQEFRCELSGNEARAAEQSLSRLKNDLVAVPFWPAVRFADQPAGPITSSLSVAFATDYSRSEVFSGDAPAWAMAGGMVCPLLFGRIESRSIQWDSPDQLSVSIAHVETGSSERSLKIETQDWDLGPYHDPAFLQRFALMPIRIHWADPRQESVQAIDSDDIGFGRDREEIVRAETSREFAAEIVASDQTDVARMLAFFSDHSSALPFWVASNSQQFTLTADIPAGSTRINESGHGVSSGDWLAFGAPGRLPEFGRVAVADDMGVTLAAPAPQLVAGHTLITRLAIARFKSDRLVIDFDSPSLATARCEFRELNQETEVSDLLSGGTTIGATLPKVWLYRITTTDAVERWTSHESELVNGPLEYLPGRITHGAMTSSISGTRDSVTVTVGISVSKIVRAILAREVFGRAKIEILDADLSGSGARDSRVVFTGEVESAKSSGTSVALTCKPWPAISETRIGRFRIQPTCNHILYSEGCGLGSPTWQFNAVMSAPGSVGWPFVFGITSLDRAIGADPAYTENWFAGGWVECGEDKVAVRSSSTVSAGAVSITLARDPRPFPATGSSVRLFPGCDGRWDTCRTKFSNGLNFGGHPHVPTSNPSLVKLSPAVNGGKK